MDSEALSASYEATAGRHADIAERLHALVVALLSAVMNGRGVEVDPELIRIVEHYRDFHRACATRHAAWAAHAREQSQKDSNA